MMRTTKYTVLLVLLTALLPWLPSTAQQTGDGMADLRKMHIALSAIEALYVEPTDGSKLVEDAIRGMLEKLDPHSTYSTPKETKEMNEPLNGSFEGIGVQFNMVDDTLMVIQPVSNGPSERVGILAGDRIVAVADTAIAGVKMSKEEIMRRLRGPKGTVARLKVVRRGISDTLRFDVTRGKIPVHSIDATYMIRPGVGYIRISNFSATTYHEFMESLETLRRKGMHSLMLDLQGNGGGYLQAAADVASEFLQRGDLIVYTDGRATGRHDYHATTNGSFREGKLVVLVDEYDAPMLDSMNDPKLQEYIRNRVRSLFSPLKAQSQYLRFVFLTGISKFSQLSVFSELNNLQQLTFNPDYEGICGITEEELLTQLKPDIEILAEKLNERDQRYGITHTYDSVVADLKYWYDGYHFSDKLTDIYCPWSLVNAFAMGRIMNFWFSTGTPTSLINILRTRTGITLTELEGYSAKLSRFDAPTERITDPIPALFQSGYLTLKEYDGRRNEWKLGFPNEEVREG